MPRSGIQTPWMSLRSTTGGRIGDISGVQVQVNTTIPSLAPEEVENLVTFPLETALGGIAGVTEMRSLSRFGLSQITLQFTDNTDIYRARQLVTEKLGQVRLPAVGPIARSVLEFGAPR